MGSLQVELSFVKGIGIGSILTISLCVCVSLLGCTSDSSSHSHFTVGGASKTAAPPIQSHHAVLLSGGGGMDGNQPDGPGEVQPYDETAPWTIVSFTDPRDSSSYDIIEGRVQVALK